MVGEFHVGGIRYMGAPAHRVQEHIRYAQHRAKIPLLVASNPEMGGFGSADDGTLVATHLQAGSAPDASVVREMGRVAGVDEQDQHVVTTWNTFDYRHWNETYGRVYRAMFDHGVQSVMVGHIGAPELSRHFRPGIADEDLMPATLAPELVTDPLRGELGFNGLVVTDASMMVGMTSAMRRRDLVPHAVAAGCDMFLFFRDPAEDLGYMLDGYRDGVISEERLQDALERILGLKASLGLHTTPKDALVPPPDAVAVVGSAQHHAVAAAAADKAVTLVKDTQHALPLSPQTHRRIRLYGVAGAADFTGVDPRGFLAIARDELEAVGFEVSVFKDARQRQAEGEENVYFHTVMADEANGHYADDYDAAIVFANVAGFAQEATVRIRWSSPMAAEIPWYVTEVPTVFVSLNQPNHLIDVPMVKTLVHAYNPSREAIHAAVQKIIGASEFHGTFNENVWCDTFATRR